MKICWIGLGNIGFSMPSHLHEACYDVHGFDVSHRARAAVPAVGRPVAKTVQDAAGVPVVVTMLPRGEHVYAAVRSGALADADRHSLVLDSTTIGAAAADIGAAAATGRRFLDAPVSGSSAGAQNSTVTFMGGGAAADLDDAAPMLQAMGARIFHAGAIGAARASSWSKHDARGEHAEDVRSRGPRPAGRLSRGIHGGRRRGLRRRQQGAAQLLPRRRCHRQRAVESPFTGRFVPTLMRKDLGLALDAAAEHGFHLAATADVARRLDQLVADAHGSPDFCAIVGLIDGTVDDETAGAV